MFSKVNTMIIEKYRMVKNASVAQISAYFSNFLNNLLRNESALWWSSAVLFKNVNSRLCILQNPSNVMVYFQLVLWYFYFDTN
jgi:hypothetical protein